MNHIAIAGIARICHQANKTLCESYGDFSQVDWEKAPEWQRTSAIKGVKFVSDAPWNSPSASHDNWYKEKEAAGWVYGPVKDPEKKEHPCMVPYDDLPVEQQVKDLLFKNIVIALTSHG